MEESITRRIGRAVMECRKTKNKRKPTGTSIKIT